MSRGSPADTLVKEITLMTNPVQGPGSVSPAVAAVGTPRKNVAEAQPEVVQDKVTISKAARAASRDTDHDGDSH